MQPNYLHKHFYEHMFFLALWACCSSVGSVFRLTRVCTNIVSVFEVICLHDSTRLPAACKRLSGSNYTSLQESKFTIQTHDPLRWALNDSRAELLWQTAYEWLQAAKLQNWLCFPVPFPDWAGGQSRRENITCRVSLWSLVCLYQCVKGCL